MTKPTTTLTKAEQKKEQRLQDEQRAIELMATYEKLKNQEKQITADYNTEAAPHFTKYQDAIAPFQKSANEKLAPVLASIKSAEAELLEIGTRQKDSPLFTDSNWRFSDTLFYLHISRETKEKLAETFSLSKFVKKFEKYVKVGYKFKELTAAFKDTKQREKFTAMGFDLKVDETVEIKQATEKKQNTEEKKVV